MTEFLQAVSDFIVTCYRYIQLLVNTILLLPTFGQFALEKLSLWFALLPETLVLFCAVIAVMCVLYMIFGR